MVSAIPTARMRKSGQPAARRGDGRGCAFYNVLRLSCGHTHGDSFPSMSTTVPSKKLIQPNTPPPGRGLGGWLWPLLSSTVGQKIVVALTGLGLTGFVIAHMAGNLGVFKSRDAYNDYAAFLKGQGALLWAARLGLLAIFLLHIFISVRLRYLSAEARPVPYSYRQIIQASLAARTMLLTGILIFLFTAFHIAHYTLGIVSRAEVESGAGWESKGYLDLRVNPTDPASHQDVYAMMWAGFHNPIIVGLYILAQVILVLHLSHGVASTLQTLGLNTPRAQPALRVLSWAVALVVGVGNILIVLAIWYGWVPAPPYSVK
jgi:succinate dehydrogenase / fumarate reductase cytochrome b subunit